MFKNSFQQSLKSMLLLSALALSSSALATKVVFDTSEGVIEVNLFDNSTPKTVENFLSYVNDGSYNNTVIHRSVPGFITQGGGYSFNGSINLSKLPTKPKVVNEPVYSNRRGTIAMAKLGDQPNSATNQWFFNLNNNQTNLDVQNSGFTVFGQVVEGMGIVDSIASISLCSSIPMPDYNCGSGDVPSVENFVTIYSITISDTSTDSASALNPVENTLIDGTGKNATSDSGGSTGLLIIFALILLMLNRRKVN
jgi:cyclophilin family peptidyl-prolyl cis-trans isomerase